MPTTDTSEKGLESLIVAALTGKLAMISTTLKTQKTGKQGMVSMTWMNRR
jgi:hypothetical protein